MADQPSTMSQADRKWIFNQCDALLQSRRVQMNGMGMLIALEALGYLRPIEEIKQEPYAEPEVHPV